jgi:NADPH:quinone reductase-like Zn-dependent oxidoreductase
MKAAIVRTPGELPVYGDFEAPVPARDEILITVNAAAINHVTRSRAAGAHYSSEDAFPFVPGIDGTGRMPDGRRVYFALPRAPFGSMAEMTVVRKQQCVPLPNNLDDVTAAAIANPGMSSWAAYTERARLKRGETVLVNGATGASGRLAVQIAKYLGAKRVIAVGRHPESLQDLTSLGADLTISLNQDDDSLEEIFKEQFAQGIDIVVDYLWGTPAERLLIAAAKAYEKETPLRYVHVGAAAGRSLALVGDVLRAAPIELMGSGIGSVPPKRMVRVVEQLLKAAPKGGFKIATHTAPLSEVTAVWPEDDSRSRTVFKI